MPVPTTREVIPGSLVNIVLKADQPTGRTVQGAVAQLLTRGNHPRGIKVRLADGRVGRVQSMAGTMTSNGVPDEPCGDTEADHRPGFAGFSRGRWERRHYTDVRQEAQPPSAQPIGLDAYIKPAKQRGKGRKAGNTTTGEVTDDNFPAAPQRPAIDPASAEQEVLACPVCEDFKGNAAALMHHVQSHFDD
ncbi:hypothetical protein C7999DRAFT_41226 [Corynascus novoguineensis]|uniref:UBZ4-type domain-containing protein n=1 Tax=Corynascus novoguineensis TaxID=1126955 RepID=A0AAN7HF97_9PEZI|nr:hypothetical protein C7999DRAFT_41226 [Corynascus novoguineensis]